MASEETQVIDNASDTAEVPAVEQVGGTVNEREAESSVRPVPVVEELTDKQREQWLKEPASYPKPPKRGRKSSQSTDKAESSPAASEPPKSDDKADSSPAPSPEKVETAETAAASAPAEPTQVEGKQPSEAEKRIKSLLSDVKLLKQKLSQYEQPAAPKQPEKSEAPDPQRPDSSQYRTPEEYFEALTDYKVGVALKQERERVAKEQQESLQARRVAEERQQWNTRVGEARKKHADFDDVALNPDLPVAEGSAIDWWVMNSEHGAEVLYHFGQHPDQLEALNQLPPIEAARELAKIEIALLTPPKPAPLPKAPRPPSEANPKGQVDPMAVAVQAGDFATYRRLKDAEERGKRS
jgi:hypothetical protein